MLPEKSGKLPLILPLLDWLKTTERGTETPDAPPNVRLPRMLKELPTSVPPLTKVLL
jgi:hypothetical protein